LAVAFFCVFLGYFAAGSAYRQSTAQYVIKRYRRFFQYLALANAAFVIINIIMRQLGLPGTIFGPQFSLWELLTSYASDTAFFTYRLVPTYWCMFDFFIGSIAAFIFAEVCRDKPLKISLLIFSLAGLMFFYASGQVWVADCLLGGLLFLLVRADLAMGKHPLLLIALLACAPRFYRDFSESYATYLFYGLSSAMFLYAVFNSVPLQRLLSWKWSAYLGSITFELYLVHPLIMQLVSAAFIRPFRGLLPEGQVFILALLMNAALCLAAALAFHRVVKRVNVDKLCLMAGH
jgi:peptidoglycan/LPS O-acetylase OafA/YrhL